MFVLQAPGTSSSAPDWPASARVLFRFCFVYFGLYVLTTTMLVGFLRAPLAPLQDGLVGWVATQVFRFPAPLATMSGSGDKPYDWVHVFCLLVVATGATLLWSVLDRNRTHYVRLHQWLRFVVRFGLGAMLVGYGMVKVIPSQMPAPSLTRLLAPFGHFSPMGVLWSSIGASLPYEIFAGCAEVVAGVLLFVPRTATLGALLALGIAVHVFTLNMTYDVPVKLFSFHLVLLSLLLLAPDASRLVAVLLSPSGADSSPVPGRSRRGYAWIGLAAQLLLGAFFVTAGLLHAVNAWQSYAGGATRSPLYGIWTVDEMWIDGESRPPLTTDPERWRRIVFDNHEVVGLQGMDDTFDFYRAQVDTERGRITLTIIGDPSMSRQLSFDRIADRLTLDGEIDGRHLRLRLSRLDHSTLPLLNRRFRWIQDYPFNR